ncbi:MAG: zf-HC2 domain-containing protein [Holophagaceae bacterium]|nr:zf-HC2 domain-containing protein [Holophagaceae bacterium]
MTACREFLELMSTSLDQDLPPDEQGRLDTHLDACPECRAAWKDLQWTHSQLKELEAVEPPPWLASKIMARIRAEAVPRASFWRRFVRPIVVMPQLQVASILLLAATGFYLLRSQRSEHDVLNEMKQFQAPASVQSQPQQPGATLDKLSPKPSNPPAEKTKPATERTDQLLLEDSKPSESGFAPPPKPSAVPPTPALTTAAPRDLEKQEKDRAHAEPAPSIETSKPSPMAGAAVGGITPVMAESAVPPTRQAKASPKGAGSRVGDARGNQAGDESRQKVAEAPNQPQVHLARKEKKEKSDAATWVIRLEMPDPRSAKILIERELAGAGATVMPQREADGPRLLKVRLNSDRLPELLSRLTRIGKVLEYPDNSSEKPALITISISW